MDTYNIRNRVINMGLEDLIAKHNVRGYICLDDELYDNYAYRWNLEEITDCPDWSEGYIPDCAVFKHGLYFSILHPAFILAHNSYRLQAIDVYEIEAYGAYREYFLEDYYCMSCIFRARSARIIRKLEREEIRYEENLYLRNDTKKTEEDVRKWFDCLKDHPELSLTEMADAIHYERWQKPRIKPALVDSPIKIQLTEKSGRRKIHEFNTAGHWCHRWLTIGIHPQGNFRYYVEHKNEFPRIMNYGLRSILINFFCSAKYDRHDYERKKRFDLDTSNDFSGFDLVRLIDILEDEIDTLRNIDCNAGNACICHNKTIKKLVWEIYYCHWEKTDTFHINRDVFRMYINHVMELLKIILNLCRDAQDRGWVLVVTGI